MQKGLLQREVADIMGISFRAYQEKIGGNHRPFKVEELVRFFNATGEPIKVDVDDEEYGITINKL